VSKSLPQIITRDDWERLIAMAASGRCSAYGCRSLPPVSVVKINAITVPRDRFDEFERRFASRAGRVSSAPGFEAFELLRPNDDREVCLVVTRWRSESDFQAWVQSPDFAVGHAQHREDGPVGTTSELWSFDVLEREEPAAEG
jgi:heme oxygenase (mycobilin-producing)